MLSFSSGLVLAFRRIPTQIDKPDLLRHYASQAQKVHVYKKVPWHPNNFHRPWFDVQCSSDSFPDRQHSCLHFQSLKLYRLDYSLFRTFYCCCFVVCLFVFSLGFTNLKYGDMNKRFPDFLMTLPTTKISRYVFKIPWLWKRMGFPLTFHYDHGKCAPIHWCRGWRLRSTNDVLWYNGLKRHYKYLNHNTIQHNNRFCNPENSVPLFGKGSFPDSFHKVLWCPSYLVSY